FEEGCAVILKEVVANAGPGGSRLGPAGFDLTDLPPCLLAPQAVKDWQDIRALAEKTLGGDRPDQADSALAAALYRLDHLPRAHKILLSLTADKTKTLPSDLFFLALTQARLGEKDRARESLALGVRRMEERPNAERLGRSDAWEQHTWR